MINRQEQLLDRIEAINDNIYSLEMADNFLLTNRNGNKSMLDNWEREKDELYAELRLIQEGVNDVIA